LPIPSMIFIEGRTYRQPEVVFHKRGISCRPFHGDQPVRLGALSEGHFMQTAVRRAILRR